MKTVSGAVLLAALACVANVTVAVADGMIHKLPADGSWVRFDVTGEGQKPGGEVAVSLKGTLTLKSVGREQVDGIECRWIEFEMTLEIQSGDRKSEKTELFKLLIPETYLVTSQNPRAHVLKAWKRDAAGATQELDLKGRNAREVESLDELLNGGLAKSEKSEGVEIKTPGGTFPCTRLDGKESSASGNIDLETQTWLTDKVPFGVAAYRHSKMRKRAGESLGGRWMELKFSKSGTDAKSAVAN
jgi:hypothetical protein